MESPTLELKINREYEALLPALSTEEYEALKQSIKDEGQHYPIIINSSREILDGHNRYRICQELRIEAKVETRNFPVKLIEKKFVIESNLRRRQLNDYAKIELAAPLLEIERQLSRNVQQLKSQKGKKGFQPVLAPNDANISADERKATAKVAKTVGLSTKTFERGLFVLKKGDQNLKDRLRKGKITIGSAYTQISFREQRTELDANLKQKSSVVPENITLFNEDFNDCLEKLPASSVQLILTDPPYGEEYLDIWEKLSFFASHVLVPGGFLIAYSPQFHLPKVLESLSKHLDYFWIMVLTVPQHRLIHSRNVFCNWKPLVVFNKPVRVLPEFFGDVVQGKGMEKELHDWQQGENEIAQIIETFCPSNGIVLDPMAGTGTTIAVARTLNRKAIGIEKDPTTFERMKGRLAE